MRVIAVPAATTGLGRDGPMDTLPFIITQEWKYVAEKENQTAEIDFRQPAKKTHYVPGLNINALIYADATATKYADLQGGHL